MKTTLYFVRHGQSIGNQQRIFLGHTDMDLTELGVAQAERTASALADVHFDRIYSSDLSRAYSTAVPHARLRGMEIIRDRDLRELYCGEWEGLSVDEIIERYGEKYTDEWTLHFGVAHIPGGESVPEGALRMYNFALRIAREHPGETILCASHAAVIRALYARVSGIAPDDVAQRLSYPSNASYSIIEFDGEHLYPVAFSCDEHMKDLRTTWVDN